MAYISSVTQTTSTFISKRRKSYNQVRVKHMDNDIEVAQKNDRFFKFYDNQQNFKMQVIAYDKIQEPTLNIFYFEVNLSVYRLKSVSSKYIYCYRHSWKTKI